jgi:hypothetical protein
MPANYPPPRAGQAQRKTSHRPFACGVAAAQANRHFAEHAQDKLLTHEGAVAVLATLGRQVHEGLTKAAAGLHSERREPVAARSVPPIL